jgi:hypothetical protein
VNGAERIKLVLLEDADVAFGLLDEMADYENGDAGAGVFGDNGGDPDGNAWLQDARAISDAEIEVLVNAGLARVVDGWRKEYYGEDDEREQMNTLAYFWCGYSGNREAFYQTLEDVSDS